MPFDLPDNFLLQNFALETAKRAFQSFAVLNMNFSQSRVSLLRNYQSNSF